MEQFEGLNWAIIQSVFAVQYDKATFSENQNPIGFDDIVIENGYNFEKIPFVFESAGFAESEKRQAAGNYFEKKLILTIPKLRTEVSSFLSSFKNRKLLLLVTDFNNESHLVFPVRMTVSRNIPGQATSLNSTVVEFSGNYKYESPIVTGFTADWSPSL